MSSFNFSLYEQASPTKKKKQEKPKSGFDFSLYEPIAADSPTEKQFSNFDIAKDVAKQGAKEFLIGAGGAYGDLSELAGIGGNTPGVEARNQADFSVLERMNQPGYKPSLADLYSLSEDDVSPQGIKFPTSENLRSVNEAIGGPGEAETTQGKYAGRIAKTYGGGLALGQVNPLPAIAAGTAGQAVEEAGGGPLLQAGAEIAALIVTPSGSARKLGEVGKKEIRQKVDELRKIGYTDEQITLAINSGSKGRVGGVKASKGAKTQQAFEDFAERSETLVEDILSGSIPGYEKGSEAIIKKASDAYGELADRSRDLKIKNPSFFDKELSGISSELKENLGLSAEAKSLISRIEDAQEAAKKNPTARQFIEFYKDLNKSGDWKDPRTKERVLTKLKNSIYNTFKHEGSEGAKLAEDFKKVNKGVEKAYKAKEAMNLLEKTIGQEGRDYKKLYKLFDKKENKALFEKVLGEKQANNLNLIAKTGKEIKDFDKAWKSVSLLGGTPASMATNLGFFLYSGNLHSLALGKGLEASARKLGELSLTDPKFQNLLLKGMHAIKVESPRSFQTAYSSMKDYLKEKAPEINLDQGKY